MTAAPATPSDVLRRSRPVLTTEATMRKATASATVVSFPPRKAAPRSRRAPRRATGVVDQVRIAISRQHLLSTVLGGVLGGFVPIATYAVAHREIAASAHGYAMLALVMGGLLFSAKTVWQWGRLAFNDPWKATGFVLLLEGVMTLSGQQSVAIAALIVLTSINAIATGVTLSRGAP